MLVAEASMFDDLFALSNVQVFFKVIKSILLLWL